MPPLPTLSKESLTLLRRSKNLLAFSGGVDSSALFFMLLQHGIPFDIAHVNYQTRTASDTEALHVKTLANNHHKEAHLFTCKLSTSNFEAEARRIRYSFFEKICQQHGYTTLITAHQLDDRFEWLMMQLCRGAGVSELLSFDELEQRPSFTLIRPLLHITKSALLDYLHVNDYPYFEDASNADLRYTRNRFRHEVCQPLLEHYASGIDASLSFLAKDAKALEGSFSHIEQELFIFTCKDEVHDMRLIDQAMKRLGVVMSQAQRKEASKESSVIAGKVAVGHTKTHGFVAPFRHVVMPKTFKEACRQAKIPKHIRGYLYEKGIDPYLLRSNS